MRVKQLCALGLCAPGAAAVGAAVVDADAVTIASVAGAHWWMDEALESGATPPTLLTHPHAHLQIVPACRYRAVADICHRTCVVATPASLAACRPAAPSPQADPDPPVEPQAAADENIGILELPLPHALRLMNQEGEGDAGVGVCSCEQEQAPRVAWATA